MEIGPFEFYSESRIIAAVREAPDADRDAELLNEVNKYALRPLEPDAFSAFTMDLCNNQIDAHHSRFPVGELEKIDMMVPGRPFMERHDTKGMLPRGTFFRSRLHEEPEREYVSVRPDVYILRTEDNRDLIANIEGGVYRATSIGFSFMRPECSICHKDIRMCDHVPGRTYGDESCHYVMHDVESVLEGSVVFSASQGTGFVAARDKRERPTVTEALKSARNAYHRPIELAGPEEIGLTNIPWTHIGEE